MPDILADPRLATLHTAAEYAYGARVEGDFIEFGTKSGESALALINAMIAFPPTVPDFPAPKTLWLCDSFLGFPKSTEAVDLASPIVASGVWGQGMSRGCSVAILRQAMRDKVGDRIAWRIVEGWYKDTAPEFAPLAEQPEELVPCQHGRRLIDCRRNGGGYICSSCIGDRPAFQRQRYSLIHADCDLYQSTMDALVPLFERGCVSPGCIVLLDDWNANHAAREFGQRRAWTELVDRFGIDASDEGGYGAYSHKFIVHSYQGAA